MGEVRKRKVSGEEKNGKGAPEPQIIQKGGGLGLIPVVLIAAILAGSGCHVIKKDTAADIAELTRFIDDLKVRNTETLELVTSLRAAVVQKDAMIENLGKSLKATEEQALATDVRMEELKQDLLNAEEASKSRTEQISNLEGKLESAKTEAEEKLNEINNIVNSLPTGVQEDLSKQGSEIVSVVSKLEALEAKVTEVLDSLTKVETEKSD